jgi:hypothetical protein
VTSGPNARWVARDSGKGQNPETDAFRAGPCCGGEISMGQRQVGSAAWRHASTFREEKAPKGNPTSAAGVKQNRPGHEGSKPSSGYPNPEGGTRREGESRRIRTFVSCMCCREPKLMRAAGVARRGNPFELDSTGG